MAKKIAVTGPTKSSVDTRECVIEILGRRAGDSFLAALWLGGFKVVPIKE